MSAYLFTAISCSSKIKPTGSAKCVSLRLNRDNGVLHNPVMPQSGGAGCIGSVPAHGTLLLSVPCLGASGGRGRNIYHLVPRSGGLVDMRPFLTTDTALLLGISGVSAVSGHSAGHYIVVRPGSRSRVYLLSRTAYGAALESVPTGRAGSCDSLYILELMSLGGGLFVLVGIV